MASSFINHHMQSIDDEDEETSSALSETFDDDRQHGRSPRSSDLTSFPTNTADNSGTDNELNSSQTLSLSMADSSQHADPEGHSSQHLDDFLEDLNADRRSSARNVKRKKFADEIIEASLRPAYYRNRSGPEKIVGKGSSSFMVDALLGNIVKSANTAPGVAKKESSGSSKTPSGGVAEKKPKRPYHRKAATVKEALPIKIDKIVPPVPIPESPQLDSMRYATSVDDPITWWNNHLSNTTQPASTANDDQPLDAKKPRGARRTVAVEQTNGKRSWMALDDLKLITAMQQLCDFPLVAKYVSFGTKMDAASLQHRWQELLEDPDITREVIDGIDKIPLETIQRIRKMRFYTSTEEDAIKSVPAGSATVEEFDILLRNYSHLFFPGRQAEDLLSNWKYLSQRVKTALGNPPPAINPELPEDLEAVRRKNRLYDIQSDGSCFGKSMISLTHHLNYRSKHVGCEVAYLKALGERVGTGSLPDQQQPKFQRDHRTSLAFLSGICVDYALVSEEATFGYSNEDSTVDIDLSLEGSIVNIEPLQGVIFLDVEGAFRIENRGSSSIYVNRFHLLQGDEVELPDNSSVDIGTLSFQFFKNGSAIKRFVEKYVRDVSDVNHRIGDGGVDHVQSDLANGSDTDEESDGSSDRNNHDAGRYLADEKMGSDDGGD